VVLVGDRRQHRSVTAGEPLKLLEDRAGLRVAEVTEILRQQGDYKKAAQALSEGRTEEGFKELDKLGWIREVPDDDRYKQLAAAYLSAVAEKKRDGTPKSALVVSPTHAEGNRITEAIRDGLRAQGRLGKERIVKAWVPAHLTEAEKADPTQYEPGELLQFHQNAKGYKKGSRLIVGEGAEPPTEFANRFELYRPTQFALAVGDRVRVTAGGTTKDGKKLSNGSLLTVQGFNKRGDIIVDHGRVIDRDFGHLTHGYALTSHASQGDTVEKVFVAISSQSLPATNERTAYVALTRGKEQAVVFTDDRKELLKAVSRPDDPLSATELSESTQQKPTLGNRLMKRLASARSLAMNGQRRGSVMGKDSMADRGMDNGR
jgi:ATP-dependent exoDNAse (exonuclease V) alpha subunit